MNYLIVKDSENELYHFGVRGMKWGVRKSRPKSSSSKKIKSSKKKSTTSKRKKLLTDSRKQTLKKVGKTAAIVAGSVASAATLGYLGNLAFSTAMREWNNSQRDVNNAMVPEDKRHGLVTDTTIRKESSTSMPNQIKENVKLMPMDPFKRFSLNDIERYNDIFVKEAIIRGNKDAYNNLSPEDKRLFDDIFEVNQIYKNNNRLLRH